MRINNFGYLHAFWPVFYLWVLLIAPNNKHVETNPFLSFALKYRVETPVAKNDTFFLAVGCDNYQVNGNLMDNDVFTADSAWISQVIPPQTGYLVWGSSGDFTFVTKLNFRGEININYKLSSIKDVNSYTEGILTIYVEDDFDCDKVVNSIDLDDDNDGIIDVHEGDQSVDTDGDGIANCNDIDSDNDGITDFTEWQNEDSQIALSLRDENLNGWDDAFDSQMGGIYYEQTDTDLDGIPDFLDVDSDNDGIMDAIEAYDILNNQNPVFKFSEMDSDRDGLDNSCDTLNSEVSRYNPIGSNSPLPDHNKNGIRDWREIEQQSIEGEEQNAVGKELKLQVYPNPVTNKCIIEIPNTEDFKGVPFSLKVYDMNGRLVHLKLLFQHQSTINLEHLLKGTYLLRVKTRDNILSARLIKYD
jgi:hypothetical protein